MQNATKRSLFEPSAIGSRLEARFLDSPSPFRATDRFNQSEPRPSALLAEVRPEPVARFYSRFKSRFRRWAAVVLSQRNGIGCTQI